MQSEFIISDNNIEKFNIKFKYNDIINRIDYWIKLAKRRKDFLNIFDLHTDKVDALKEQFFNSIDTFILNTTTKEEYKKEIEYIHNKYENIIGRMPSYFKSNHLYTSISSISPALFTEYFLYCGNETLSRFIEEIFYYGLNHG